MSNIAGFGRPGNDPRGQGPNDEPSFGDRIASWWSRVPMFIRFICNIYKFQINLTNNL